MRLPALYLLPVLLLTVRPLSAQELPSADSNAISRIMQVLSHDSMEGRGNLQPGLLKAALFTVEEFRQPGVLPWPGEPYLCQAFRPAGGKKNETGDRLQWNGKEKDRAAFVFFHGRPGVYPDHDKSYFLIKEIALIDDSTFLRVDTGASPLLLWCRQPLAKGQRVDRIKYRFPAQGLVRDVLLVVADTVPAGLRLSADEKFYASLEYNIAGILPGLSRETILFSAHYDHEGIMSPGKKGEDRTMNGANDNASGTAAVLSLLSSFSRAPQQQRTLGFICFAGEELGLEGSKEFTRTKFTDSIVAMVNIEMIGVPQLGKKTVFITGPNDSGLPDLLGAGLRANGLVLVQDPVPDRDLYGRSDNYPFALRDIPAHTVMGSTDDDACYHQVCDEIGRIDIANLTDIINVIRVAMKPFIDGSISPEKIRKG
ncbi:MAG: M28 family peptidase [Chitinophagaceae bacterium]|nr:MAG: M28 family peptidase [Chitinophagaceae bacterium]